MSEMLDYMVGIEIPNSEFDYWLTQKEVDLTRLLGDAEIYTSFNNTHVLKWIWVSWHPDVFDYVAWIENRLETLDPDTYTFIKLTSGSIHEQGLVCGGNVTTSIDIQLDHHNLTQIA